MLNDLITVLILTQREQQRLNTQAKRLSQYNLDDEQLSSLRKRWQSVLGYPMYTSPLLGSLDHLIEQLQQGEYHLEDYDQVVVQLSAYRHSCWALLRQTFGNPSRYLDRWGNVKPQFRYAFEEAYEANAKLSVEAQANWLHRLLPGLPTANTTSSEWATNPNGLLGQLTPPSNVLPEEDTLSPTHEPTEQRHHNVVNLAAYRQRRKT